MLDRDYKQKTRNSETRDELPIQRKPRERPTLLRGVEG